MQNPSASRFKLCEPGMNRERDCLLACGAVGQNRHAWEESRRLYTRLEDGDGWLVYGADDGAAVGNVADNTHDNVGRPRIQPCAQR